MKQRRYVIVATSLFAISVLACLLIWTQTNDEPKGRSVIPRPLSVGWIGGSLDRHKRTYGDIFEVSTYRPDLYPTSYIFKQDGITVTITPLPKAVAKIDVFFESVPPESVEMLLDATPAFLVGRSDR